MRLKRAFLVASVACATHAACSTFTASDAPAPADAGDELPSPPAPPPIDAGADAPFCTGMDASFCWSFDQGTDPRGPLLAYNPFDNTMPSLTTAALSPPNAMECTTPTGDGGLRTCALDLRRNAKTHLRCDVAIYVAPNDAGPFDPLLLVQQDFHTYALVVSTDGRAALWHDGIASTDIGNVPFEVWTTLGFEVTLGSHKTSATGYVEGASQSREDDYGDASTPVLGNFSVSFGPTYAADGWTVRYDNLVCNSD